MKCKYLIVVILCSNLAFAGNVDLGFTSSPPSPPPTGQPSDSLPISQTSSTNNPPIQNTSPVLSKEDAFLIRQVNSGLPSTVYSSKTDIPDYYVVVNRNIKPIIPPAAQTLPAQTDKGNIQTQPHPTPAPVLQQAINQEVVKISNLQQQDKVVISNNATTSSKATPKNGVAPTPKPYTFKAIPEDSMKPQIIYSN